MTMKVRREVRHTKCEPVTNEFLYGMDMTVADLRLPAEQKGAVMTCTERLRHIAKHGPVINMTVTDADRVLFDAGLIIANRNAVYVSPDGILFLAARCCA